jgi:hypothetical protein
MSRLASFRAAVRIHDMPTMLRLQRELLTSADQADIALKNDQSPEADSVRQAIADLRTGVAGDNNGLDHATSELNSALSGHAGGFITITSETSPVANTSHSLDQLSEDFRNFRQALKDHNADGALKLQGQLLEELPAIQQSVQKDDSDQGRALHAALASLQKGLDGDSQQLAAASTALGKLAAPASAPTNVDTAQIVGSLASKMDAFQMAASTNSRSDLDGDGAIVAEMKIKVTSGEPYVPHAYLYEIGDLQPLQDVRLTAAPGQHGRLAARFEQAEAGTPYAISLGIFDRAGKLRKWFNNVATLAVVDGQLTTPKVDTLTTELGCGS